MQSIIDNIDLLRSKYGEMLMLFDGSCFENPPNSYQFEVTADKIVALVFMERWSLKNCEIVGKEVKHEDSLNFRLGFCTNESVINIKVEGVEIYTNTKSFTQGFENYIDRVTPRIIELN
ncbi:hypothetical protein [Flammeovirga agarivorans]|uniref:Uncharacterized protein n=1 Tax=Flammeovirga agarivorans TaxID=2726742 RepID=A0A7X8SR67_9BACT|nr:hypothetical protein [Flammeovirga agarivorans]NLR94901.1 hypothetical protein [Flammeovirga agarivorans]